MHYGIVDIRRSPCRRVVVIALTDTKAHAYVAKLGDGPGFEVGGRGQDDLPVDPSLNVRVATAVVAAKCARRLLRAQIVYS